MFGLWLYTVYTTIGKLPACYVRYRMEHRILLRGGTSPCTSTVYQVPVRVLY